MKCKFCGADLEDGAVFCSNCGNFVNGGLGAGSDDSTEQPSVPPFEHEEEEIPKGIADLNSLLSGTDDIGEGLSQTPGLTMPSQIKTPKDIEAEKSSETDGSGLDSLVGGEAPKSLDDLKSLFGDDKPQKPKEEKKPESSSSADVPLGQRKGVRIPSLTMPSEMTRPTPKKPKEVAAPVEEAAAAPVEAAAAATPVEEAVAAPVEAAAAAAPVEAVAAPVEAATAAAPVEAATAAAPVEEAAAAPAAEEVKTEEPSGDSNKVDETKIPGLIMPESIHGFENTNNVNNNNTEPKSAQPQKPAEPLVSEQAAATAQPAPPTPPIPPVPPVQPIEDTKQKKKRRKLSEITIGGGKNKAEKAEKKKKKKGKMSQPAPIAPNQAVQNGAPVPNGQVAQNGEAVPNGVPAPNSTPAPMPMHGGKKKSNGTVLLIIVGVLVVAAAAILAILVMFVIPKIQEAKNSEPQVEVATTVAQGVEDTTAVPSDSAEVPSVSESESETVAESESVDSVFRQTESETSFAGVGEVGGDEAQGPTDQNSVGNSQIIQLITDNVMSQFGYQSITYDAATTSYVVTILDTDLQNFIDQGDSAGWQAKVQTYIDNNTGTHSVMQSTGRVESVTYNVVGQDGGSPILTITDGQQVYSAMQ